MTRLRYSGFDTTELSQVVLQACTKGSHFTDPSQGAVYDLSVYPNRFATLEENYDWIISLPLANRQYKLENIHHNSRKESQGEQCFNSTYYMLNGVAMEVPGRDLRGGSAMTTADIYIVK